MREPLIRMFDENPGLQDEIIHIVLQAAAGPAAESDKPNDENKTKIPE